MKKLKQFWSNLRAECWSRMFGAGASGARVIHFMIACSMMTMVGVTFKNLRVGWHTRSQPSHTNQQSPIQ